MGLNRRTSLAGALSTTALAATGCAGKVAKPGDLSRLRVMVPASPGGGWDTTARLLVAVLAVVGPPVLRRFRNREVVPA